MPDNFLLGLRVVAIALSIGVGLFWIAWCIAVAALPAAGAAIRSCAALTIGMWSSVLLFVVLSTMHAFRLPAVIPVLAMCAGLAHLTTARTHPWKSLITDGRSVVAFARWIARSPFAIPLGLAALILAARVIRGLMAPSMAWDDLTYHLLRAGRWVHAGGWTIAPAPNAWGYSEYFPPVGDVSWAWALLAAQGDSLLVAANLIIFVAVLVAAFAIARHVGASDVEAVVAASVIAFTPASVNFLSSGYVEPTTLALFLLAAVFMARLSAATPDWPDALLAAAALGLAAGIKVSNIAFVLPGIVVVVAGILKAPWSRLTRARVLALTALAALISAPFYIRAWIDTGSPSYPIPVEIGSTVMLSGNEWQRLIFSLPLGPPADDSFRNLFVTLFIPTGSVFSAGGQFMNLGPAFLLLAIPAALGLGRLFRRARMKSVVVFLSLGSALVVASALSANTANLRTFFGWSLARFLLVPAATLVIFAASGEYRLKPLLLAAALVINCALAIPLGWSATDAMALRAAAPVAVPLAGVGLLFTFLLIRFRRPSASVAMGMITTAAVLAVLLPARDSSRYSYFKDLADGRAYSVNRDAASLARAWRVWRALDRPEALTIAVTGDWGAMSPLGARYPLLGTRLQNRVEYVPVTTSGDIVDRPEFYANLDAGDFNAWLTRLRDRHIDYVAVLSPSTIEGRWAREHSDLFIEEPLEFGDVGLVYRVNR